MDVKHIVHDTPTNTLFNLRYGERKSKVKRRLRIILGRVELLARSKQRRDWRSLARKTLAEE